MFVLANTWFQTLMRVFFFSIDKIVYNFIPIIYDFLITIARTSILSQADILDMASRVYRLLAVFMVFKVTFSLIMYTINPDDFSDKTKGIGKLTTNIVISLGLLILTPFIFNYAYQLQTIVLEDNSLGVLIFGKAVDGSESYFDTAGDKMAYMTVLPFFSPNLALGDLYNCSSMVNVDGSFSNNCKAALEGLDVDKVTIGNYVAGIENKNLALTFRMDMATAVDKDKGEYVIDYRYVFSTVVGVIIILLLITFCMDVALRSIKLAFLQLVAPIPIISYVDPKSGKDGLFKKWYQMCFKTFLSLFVRLLALYFAVYVISRIDKMVDIVDGSYVTNALVKIAIIIGALMFAKQLPKILEGLGIKLDGDGKFFLNPIKKFQEQALGGKQIVGATKGALIGGAMGIAGAATGAGFGRALTGWATGMKAGIQGKKAGEIRKDQATRNAEMRRAIASGSSWRERMGARVSSFVGTPGRLGHIQHDKMDLQNRIDNLNGEKASIQHAISGSDQQVTRHKRLQESISSMEKRAKSEIEQGHSAHGIEYLQRKTQADKAEELYRTGGKVGDFTKMRLYERDAHGNIVYDRNGKAVLMGEGEYQVLEDGVMKKKTLTKADDPITAEIAAAIRADANDFLGDIGMKGYMTDAVAGTIDDKTFANIYNNSYKANVSEIGGLTEFATGVELHRQFGQSKGEVGRIENEIYDQRRAIEAIEAQQSEYNSQMQQLNAQERDAKASVQAVHGTEGGPSSPSTITPLESTIAYRTGGPGSGMAPAENGYGGAAPVPRAGTGGRGTRTP